MTKLEGFIRASSFYDLRFQFRISGFVLISTPMPQFSYRARNAEGALVEGVLECPDRAVAIRQIEQQRCIPIKIEMIVAGPSAATGRNGAEPAAAPTQNLKVPHGQLLLFTEQLAHLLHRSEEHTSELQSRFGI